jgi:hypothetical protein
VNLLWGWLLNCDEVFVKQNRIFRSSLFVEVLNIVTAIYTIMVINLNYDNDCHDNKVSNNDGNINKKNDRLQKKDQIPTEYNEEQTLRALRKQDQVPGEGKRSKTINDMPSAAALAQILKDLEFPANKSKIVEFIRQKKINDPKSNRILPILDKIEEKQYQNVADITISAKLVQ